MSDDTLDHEEALRRIDEQLGERVYFGVIVRRTDTAYRGGIVETSAPLDTSLMERPPRLGQGVGFYSFGSLDVCLPPMPGVIREHDHGLNFELADGVVIRVAWRPAPGKPPIGLEGASLPQPSEDSPAETSPRVQVVEDPTPTEYWAEIIEQRRVQDPETGVFRNETTPECRTIEWQGTALTEKQAQEAAMAAFEERYGERPECYFAAAYTYDPRLGGIRGRPGPGRREHRPG